MSASDSELLQELSLAPHAEAFPAGLDATRISREWQLTNTLWSIAQRIIAVIALIACLPLFAVIFFPVRMSAHASFLFRQRRPGFMGRPMVILKVRTMRAGAEKVTSFERVVPPSDPHVTWIGRILRDTKLDELPQLFSVVTGEMELVGPRPIAPALDELLSRDIPGFNNRYLVKPGLTNISQVSILENLPEDRMLEDWKVRFEGEMHYVSHKSVFYDLIVIGLTCVFLCRKIIRRAASALMPSRTVEATG